MSSADFVNGLLDRPADVVSNTQIKIVMTDIERARRLAFLLEKGAAALKP